MSEFICILSPSLSKEAATNVFHKKLHNSVLGLDLILNLQVFRCKIAALKDSQIKELHDITLHSYLTELLNPKERFV